MYEGDKLYNSIDTNHVFLLPSELPAHVLHMTVHLSKNIKSECFGSFTQDVNV